MEFLQLSCFQLATVDQMNRSLIMEVLSHSPDTSLIVDQDGRISDCNPAACRLLGYARTEIVGLPAAGLVTPDHQQESAAHFNQTMSGAGAASFESRWLAKDGSSIDAAISLTPLPASDGKVSAVLMQMRDITAYKRAEAAYRDREFRLEAIVNYSPSALSLKTPEGVYVLANPNLQKIHHLPEDRIVGKSDFDLYPEPIARAFRENDQLVVRTVARQSVEELVPVDGHLRTYTSHMFPVFDADGIPKFICRISLDVTDKKRAEAEVKKLAQAVEQSPVSVMITDSRGIIEYVNDSFARTTGYSSGESLGHTPGFLSSGKTPPETFKALQKCLDEGRTWKGEFINRRKNGVEYFDAATISPIRRADGSISHFVATQEDISKRKESERELLQYRLHLEEMVESRTRELSLAMAAAEQTNQAKSTFLAMMSHEIRTPLAGVIGQAWLLRKRSDLDPSVLSDIAQIDSAANLLLHLVDDILDVSKIEAGKISFESAPFRLDQVLCQIESLVRPQALGKGLILQIGELPDQACANVLGDSTKTRQILLNLLNNAVKFTERGRVDLLVSVIEPARPDRDGQTIQRLSFRVRDSGSGIAAESLQKLFQPFQQADSSITRKHGGTGLGLAIVKQLCEAMGGLVRAESTPGVGSCFTVELPFRIVTEAAGVTPIADQLDPTKIWLDNVRVLLVDDSAMNLRIAGRMLELEGARVSFAKNGLDALDWLQRSGNVADIVLMDVQMPVMDGNTAVRKIREIESLKNLPVIALTAGALASERENSMAAGMDDYLTKPFEPERMVRTVRRQIETATGNAVPVVTR